MKCVFSRLQHLAEVFQLTFEQLQELHCTVTICSYWEAYSQQFYFLLSFISYSVS